MPEILVIHLKRFQYTKYWRDKIDSYVDYPIHDLDLEGYVLSDEVSALIKVSIRRADLTDHFYA